MSTEDGLRKLEDELRIARDHGERATRELHRSMLGDLRDARREAKAQRERADAERKRAAKAVRRAERAERELAQLKASSTWRAGRAVTAIPVRLRGIAKR